MNQLTFLAHAGHVHGANSAGATAPMIASPLTIICGTLMVIVGIIALVAVYRGTRSTPGETEARSGDKHQ